MADQAGGWNVVSSQPDAPAQPTVAPPTTQISSGAPAGAWNVVSSQTDPIYTNPNTPKPTGMVLPGNTDLSKLPVVNNQDGSYSTVYSTSFEDEKPGSPTFGKEVLVRGILNGKKTDDINALRQEYYRTGKHLGVFDSGDNATPYGQRLHSDWAAGKIPGVQMGTPAPSAAPGLPSPDLVDQQTTQHAHALAAILLQTGAPPVMAPALPLGLRTRENSPAIAAEVDAQPNPFAALDSSYGKAKFAANAVDPFGVASGLVDVAAGGNKIATGRNMRERAGGVHQAIGGVFDAATPTMAGAVAKAPIKTAVTIAAGMVSQAGVEKGLKRLGMPPEYAAVAGDLAGIIAGVGTHSAMSSKAVTAIKARIGPKLQERFAKTTAPAATANSTGAEAYKPPVPQPAQPSAAPVAADTAHTSSIPPAAEAEGARKRLPGEKYSAWQTRIAELDKAAHPTVEPGWNVVSSTPEPSTIEQPGASDGKRTAATADAGATGKEREVHGSTPPGPRRFVGKAVRVLIPGEGRSIPAHYEARELDDINASHIGETFAPNPRYKLKNERDYSKPENQQRVIEQSSEEKFEPRYHINNNPDMANGPPLLFDEDEGPDAIGGNSRVMGAQRVFARDRGKAQAYRDAFAEDAAHYGIDSQAVRGMRKPYLVRVADRGAMDDIPGGTKWAIRKTNVQGQAALSASERAAADAGQMSPEMIGHIAGAIEDAGPDATLNDALTGRSGTVIVNRLIAEGFFSEQERPGLMDGKTGALTQAAKDRISKALLGQFFRDSDQIARTPASIRNKLERVAAPLAKVAGDPEWDLTPEVREALDLTEYATAHGIRNLADVVSQTGMFGEAPRWTDGAVRLAELLRDGKPNEVVAAFRKYVNSKEPTMFGESTPAEAFREAFGAEKPPAAQEKTPAAQPEQPIAAPIAAPAEQPASKPREPAGPTYMGSGLGAFEPFLRESYEDMKALKAKRDAAIAELERSKTTAGEKRWGEQVRHYFTAERDVWAARANQGIAKVRKLTSPSRNRRTGVDTLAEAVAIAREFKGRPDDLRSILGGYHPDLAGIEDPKEYERVTARIQALRPAIERALQPMDAGMKAVDQFYTNMAEMTADEGKRTGALQTTWDPETYVPHVLNPKGEGVLPGARKAVGQAMGGRIGKYFGFAQERSYPTLLDAVMHDVIPKTMNIHDAFTIQQDHFARSRATRLLEEQLRATDIGKYTVKKLAPEGWVKLAPQADEFQQLVPYDTGAVDEQGQAVLDTATKRLYVPKFIEEALRPITSPDFTTEILAVHALRVTQAATKAAQLGLSFFHATTENYMALANMGLKGFAKALAADRDSAQFLAAERDLIAHGGTTSIQGNTVEAYRAMQPGSIPTYGDIWRQNAAVKIMDQAAHAISDFTFANMQRRFKVTDYQLHTAAWMAEHPDVWGRDLTMAKQSIAKEINAIYGGLHWENIGLNKSTVEIARAVMLAPDWTLSNIFNVKYAFEKGPGGRMARMFWARTLVGGVVATQAASLMFSGKMSKRPTMVYMGHDRDGQEIYQNIFFKGAPGDATNLVSNVWDYGLQGIARSLAGKGAPAIRTAIQLIGNRDYLGHEIAPKGMNPIASSARTAYAAGKSMLPVPLSLTNQIDMLFGPEAHKYTWPERLATMFAGNPPSHVAPAGTHMGSDGILRPNAAREENSVLDQLKTGRVYKSRGER